MKRPIQIFSFTALIVGVTVVTTLMTSTAQGTKRASLESGDIAYVDVFTLIDLALTVDAMADARAQFNTDSTEQITQLQNQLQSLQAQLSTMQQSDPTAAQVYQNYQLTENRLQNASQQINSDYQRLIANQISQAYDEIYAAANEVGLSEGFSFVFATRSTGELMQTETITGITQEILARPLMTPPTGANLTQLVRVKLGYPEKMVEAVDAETETEATPVDATQEVEETPAEPMSEEE